MKRLVFCFKSPNAIFESLTYNRIYCHWGINFSNCSIWKILSSKITNSIFKNKNVTEIEVNVQTFIHAINWVSWITTNVFTPVNVCFPCCHNNVGLSSNIIGLSFQVFWNINTTTLGLTRAQCCSIICFFVTNFNPIHSIILLWLVKKRRARCLDFMIYF